MSDLKLNVKYIEKNPFKFATESSVEDLSKTVTYLHNSYHQEQPLVTDDVFDILKEVLEDRDPINKYFLKIGAEISKEKVLLPYFMGSMDKIKPDSNALERWVKKYKGPYFLSDKLDGVSCLLQCDLKDTKNVTKLFTRGDGTKGQDISYLAKLLKLPKCKTSIVVRGELIMKKSIFEKKYQKKYANSRNLVAGQINSKHYDPKIIKDIDFVVYEVIEPREKPSKQMKNAEQQGFDVVKNKVKDEIDNNILSDYLVNRREKSDYLIDGIVVLDNNKNPINKEKNPKWGFAFKMVLSDQGGEAVVLDVEWNASKHGIMKPVLWIGDHSGKPLEIAGVKIKRVTAFNAAYIRDNNLGPGSIVHVIRSGDVIPYITEVVKPAKEPRYPNGKEGIDWIWNKTGIDIELLNTNTNKEVKIKKLISFFKKLQVANVSEGMINKLYENNYTDLDSIINASVDDFKKIDGIQTTMANKMYKNIHESLEKAYLSQIIAASTVFGIGYGEKRLQPIIDLLKDNKILKKTFNLKMKNDDLISMISDIEGFQEKTASGFVNKLEKFNIFKEEHPALNIDKLIEDEEEKKDDGETGIKFMDGISVVFTGFRNKDIEKDIIEAGGSISSSVSKKITYLVCKDIDSDSSKIEKAKKDGVKVLDENGIREVILSEKKKLGDLLPEKKIKIDKSPKKKIAEELPKKKSPKKILMYHTPEDEQEVIISKELSNPLKDYYVLFTGFRDLALEKVIIINGGTVAKSISQYISALVTVDKESKSSKMLKAKELGISIYNREEFDKIIKKKISCAIEKNNNDVKKYVNNEPNSINNILVIKKTKKKLEKPKQIIMTNHNSNVEKIIEKKGWKLGKSFGKNVDMLVVTNNDPKKKLEKAKKKDVDILTSNEFKTKYSDEIDLENKKIVKKTKKKPNKILLTNDSRNDLKELALSKDIQVGKNFGKTVDLLVVSDNDPKNKEKKAFEKGVDTMQNIEFIKEYDK